jgi:3-deoxy-manno-octulosonate cytidylyltransferase (CMP-KDO synthetase)
MRTIIIIPARLNSTRLPRKLLLAETGVSLIEHVARQCYHCHAPDEMILAAPNDDATEISNAVRRQVFTTSSWPKVAHTASHHPNGTSRAAQVMLFADQICQRPDGWWEAYCIVQADYPEIPPELIDEVVNQLEQHPDWDCATACGPLGGSITWEECFDGNRVKVFLGDDNCAVDFSRDSRGLNPLNYDRLGIHIGIYCYRRAALLRYSAAGPCEREQAESLEQLRALHIGLKMGVVPWDKPVAGIDTREDYDLFVKRWKSKA